MLRRKKVTPGQRYRSQQYASIEWEVVDTYDDTSGTPHARLFLVGDPHSRKTIGCAQLLDTKHFALVAPSSGRASGVDIPSPAA
jgi:hypothetical protein